MNRIRLLRKQKKMTQKELAYYLQIADSTLSYWEMGKYEPDIDSLKKLSKFFSVPIDYIVGDNFSESGITAESIAGASIGEQTHFSAALKVAEPVTVYESKQTQNAFSRDEFVGLTLEEVDKLAEYAAFIKSLRSSGTQ